ncbi:MAG: glycine oxidase ThiO [Gemmataceae bacterium]
MSQAADVLIIGGGVIGLTTAWYLAGEGVKVTLVEQGEIGRQASWAGAGILPPADVGHAHSSFDQLRAHSLALHPQLAGELREATGVDNGYVVCGGVEVSDPEQPDTPLPTEEWHGEGVRFEPLDAAGLTRVVPGIAPTVSQGVFLPGMAQLRNPWHLRALQTGCAVRGVKLLPGTPVGRLIRDRQRVDGVETPAGRLLAEQVLIAAGAWSAQLLRQAGWEPPIRPVRGQMVLFRTGRPGVRPILLRGKRYLVPRTDGRVLAGSTEEDAGFDATTTDEGVAGLVAFATRLMPSLGSAEVEKAWAGLRPGCPEGRPFLGPVPGWDNLHVGAGHFRAGLLLSPATGLVLAQSLLRRPTLVPLDDFSLVRLSPPGRY